MAHPALSVPSSPRVDVTGSATVAPTRTAGGVAAATLAMVCFCYSDAMAKYLSPTVPAIEIAWCRYIVMVAAMLPSIAADPRVLLSSRPVAQCGRGCGLLGSALFFILALRFIPIAEATALAFVSPFFVTALSVWILGEHVRTYRWIAATIGFAGVLIIVRPGAPASGYAAVLPFLCAISWAFGVVLTRKIGGADSVITSLAFSGIVGLVVTTVMVPFAFVRLTGRELTAALEMAVAWTVAQWLIVMAYRRAKASVLAPLSYTRMIWASILGYTMFGTIPDRWTWVGIGIIVGCELFTVVHERGAGDGIVLEKEGVV